MGPMGSGALHPRSVTAAVTPFVRHMGLRCMQGAMPHRGSVFLALQEGCWVAWHRRSITC